MQDTKVDLSHRDLTDSNAIQVLEASESASGQVHGRLQILYKLTPCLLHFWVLLTSPNSFTPARQPWVDDGGRYFEKNAEAPISFTQDTFNRIVEILGFHRGFFSKHRHCQMARLDSGQIKSKWKDLPVSIF
jgi:hypothetical protein